jgi:tRNA nucleotidyltransferase/poly(A) polymerase
MSFGEAWRALREEPRVRRMAELARPRRLFLVGGCVRDAALGVPAKDLDLTVDRDAAAIAERFGEDGRATVVHLGGERFAAIRLVDSSGTIDLLDLEGTTLEEDLRRRDFTINAIAVDVESGEIHDPSGGRSDLEHRLLRATRSTVFVEDPLRALRLARLLLTLPGFTAEAETETLARHALPGLASVAHERIRDELDRILARPDLAAAIRTLARLGLLRQLFDEGTAKLLAERSATRFALLAPGASAFPESTPFQQRTLHWSFLGAIAGSRPEDARAFLDAAHRTGLLSRATLEPARSLLAPGWTPPPDTTSRRRWLHEAGRRWREALRLRGALAASADLRSRWQLLEEEIEALGEATRREILQPRAWLDGDEVQKILGVGPGPAVGAALEALRRAQVEGGIGSREEAEALLRRLE